MPKKNGYRMGTRRNRRQEDSVDYKHERCSNSLVVREIQMKTVQWHIFSHLSDCQKLKTWPHQGLAKCEDFYTVPLGMKIGKMTLGKTFSFFTSTDVLQRQSSINAWGNMFIQECSLRHCSQEWETNGMSIIQRRDKWSLLYIWERILCNNWMNVWDKPG